MQLQVKRENIGQVRAIDINGNEAAWQQLDVDLDLDMTSPTLSTISLRAQPASGWYNIAQRPSFQWSSASDSHSGVQKYAPMLNAVQNTTQLTATHHLHSLIVRGQFPGFLPKAWLNLSIGSGQSSAKRRNAKHRLLLRPLSADTSRFILNRVAHHQHASGAVFGWKRFWERIGVLQFDGCRHDNQRGWLIVRTERCVPSDAS